jgi:hypothetical protein
MYVSRTSEFEVDLLADSRTDYWWESGAMWGSLIDYWHFTGDTSYNSVIEAGIQWQVGEHDDMMPSNWSQSMGNDDQGFWGMTAMTAAASKTHLRINRRGCLLHRQYSILRLKDWLSRLCAVEGRLTCSRFKLAF